MSKIERFEDLKCWQSVRELVKSIYILSSSGKMANDFDMKSQFRRAGLSIMNNIAEGFSRFSKKETIHFLDIVQSSAAEVKSMTYVFEDLLYLKNNELIDLQEKTDQTRNLTLGFIK